VALSLKEELRGIDGAITREGSFNSAPGAKREDIEENGEARAGDQKEKRAEKAEEREKNAAKIVQPDRMTIGFMTRRPNSWPIGRMIISRNLHCITIWTYCPENLSSVDIFI